MSRSSRFLPLDLSSYAWQQSKNSPDQWWRRAIGGETLWIPRPKDHHEMFIGGSLTLRTPSQSHVIERAARAAWRGLRFEVPELAVSASYAEDEIAYMHYETPQNDVVVSQWVESTSFFERGKRWLCFENLLEKIRERKIGHESEQAFLFLHQVTENGDVTVKSVDFMLNADHQITDGIGIRIILHRFLGLLSETLSVPLAAKEELDWQECVGNLNPPWTSLLDAEQVFSGPEYERVAESNEEILYHKMPQNPGLSLLQPTRPSTQKTHFITIPAPQTTTLLYAIKSHISPLSNITHLGHAAMVLALLRSQPPPSLNPSQSLCSPCWLNGRRYLKPTQDHPEPRRSYIPICQSFAPIFFEELGNLVFKKNATQEEVKRMLGKACRIAGEEYGKVKTRKSMLPECVELFERLGKNMWLRKQQELLADKQRVLAPSVPVPDASGAATVPSTRQDSPIRTADPFFLSDGIMEQYIDHEYYDTAGNKTFEVDDLRFAANAEENLIVRMSSWKGCTTISGEWNECDYDSTMILGFLEDVRDIMVSIID